ncbi:Cdc37 N terminal kinase binding-domain-containing protein [Boletus edulis BED1]|uniref:Hsp90 chaperone protein kinase-targeting subunit n=1 Tax=Boletus edulis BED1 TaxID=1328754 RepID=A0AAD4BY64_BOLED|nr:Cdc37 N terminal kinase binding-domain-containing protein [Boletus edulis BED1]
MPLNYSKWDQLELSDDSDIEGHPNVDKRSLIRWKQRDIHEKRDARKHRIEALNAEIACNNVLQPRLVRIKQRIAGAEGDLAEDADGGQSLTGLPFFQYLVNRLQSNPSPAAPPTNAKDQPTYDAMILSLLIQIYDTVKVLPEDEQEKAILDGMEKHTTQLSEHTCELQADLDTEIKEQKKHITSEDIHEGWESKYVPPKPAPPPIKNAISDTTPKTKITKPTTTTYEVLNPAASSSHAAAVPSAEDISNEDEQEEELPELTPSLARFSRLPLWDYAQSFALIQNNRDVVVPGASDALLVAAFQAETDGRGKYAKQCVHQSLLLQYCNKLGRDGVRLFFQKMITGDKRAIPIFVKDVEDTYAHLVTRVAAAATEASSSTSQKEQIQLVPENPDSTISFNVPDGPPPDDLVLEGPGTEGLDVEEVRKALMMRWTVFNGFSDALQDALRVGTLETVNKVLAEMDVGEAEDVVSKLDLAGIMSFAAGGVRDETGNAKNVDEDME